MDTIEHIPEGETVRLLQVWPAGLVQGQHFTALGADGKVTGWSTPSFHRSAGMDLRYTLRSATELTSAWVHLSAIDGNTNVLRVTRVDRSMWSLPLSSEQPSKPDKQCLYGGSRLQVASIAADNCAGPERTPEPEEAALHEQLLRAVQAFLNTSLGSQFKVIH